MYNVFYVVESLYLILFISEGQISFRIHYRHKSSAIFCVLSMEILAVLGDVLLDLLSLRTMSSCINCRFAARLSKRGGKLGNQ